MRILLAHPAFPRDTFWSFDRALRVAGRRATMPPLGLLTVAGMLDPERFELRLADENVRAIEDADLRWADAVFVSGMVVQKAAMERVVARAKALGVPVVAGGPLVGGAFEQLARAGFDPDAWFLGEAEELAPELARDLEAGCLKRVYAHAADEEKAAAVRAVFGDEARVHVGPLPELTSAPIPRFDLLELRHYHSMAVQASRGCPIACEFCDIWKQLGRKARTAPSARVVEQLAYLFTLGWRGRVFVVDDNFIGNVKAAGELLPAIQAWQDGDKQPFVPAAHARAMGAGRLRRLERRARRRRRERRPFAFSTEADVRLGDEAPKTRALLEAMVGAGFGCVFLGIETPGAAALAEAGKRVNVGRDGDAATHLLARVRRIQAAGLETTAGFIVGFDHDPEDIDDAMIDFVERAGIPLAMVGTLGVLPGTDLQRRLEREGRFRGRLFGDQTHAFELNYQPAGRSEERVLDQYARVLRALFGGRMESYYERAERLMDALPAPPPTGDRVGLRALLAFARSLAFVRPRRAYLAFLARTLRRRPRFFGLAVVLALQGEHLHRLTMRRVGEWEARRARAPRPEPSSSSSLALSTESAG